MLDYEMKKMSAVAFCCLSLHRTVKTMLLMALILWLQAHCEDNQMVWLRPTINTIALQNGKWCEWQAWSCETPRFPNVHKERSCHTVRYRECNCPAPLGRNARNCPGDSSDSTSSPEESFRLHCQKNWDCKGSQRTSADAPWCQWSTWSQWDATCGNISRTRVRQCDCVFAESPVTCVSMDTRLRNTQRGNGYETHQQFHHVPCPKAQVQRSNWCEWSEWSSCDCQRGSWEKTRTCQCPQVSNDFCGSDSKMISEVNFGFCSCYVDDVTTKMTTNYVSTTATKIIPSLVRKVSEIGLESESSAQFKRNFVIGVSIIVTLVLSGMLFLIGRGIFRTCKRCRSQHIEYHSDTSNSVFPVGRRWCLRQQQLLEKEKLNRVPLSTSQFTRLCQSQNEWNQATKPNSLHNLHEINDHQTL